MHIQLEEDRVADLWNTGALSFSRGAARPSNPVAADGWDDAKRASKVRVLGPRRPEGYYHAAPGTFD